MRAIAIITVAACWIGDAPPPRRAPERDWVSCIERVLVRHPLPELGKPEDECARGATLDDWFCRSALFEGLSIQQRWWIDRAIAVCSRRDL